MFSTAPSSLGLPGEVSQSMYYPGSFNLTREEISAISKDLERQSVYPENTQIQKSISTGTTTYNVHVASAEGGKDALEFPPSGLIAIARIILGNRLDSLNLICNELMQAINFAANEIQQKFLAEYIDSFRTGSVNAYRESQRTWIMDKQPQIENSTAL